MSWHQKYTFKTIDVGCFRNNQAFMAGRAYQKFKSNVKVQQSLYCIVDYKGISVHSCFALWMRSRPKFEVAVQTLPIFASLNVYMTNWIQFFSWKKEGQYKIIQKYQSKNIKHAWEVLAQLKTFWYRKHKHKMLRYMFIHCSLNILIIFDIQSILPKLSYSR